MKTESYIEYLETLVLSLLHERGTDDDIVITDTENPSFKGCTFSPLLAKMRIYENQFTNYRNTIIGKEFPADRFGAKFRVVRANMEQIGVVLIKDGKEVSETDLSRKAFDALNNSLMRDENDYA